MKRIYMTQSIYLAASLACLDNFEIGKIFISEQDKTTNKATIEILYDEDYQLALDSYMKLFDQKKMVVYQDRYQKSIRFIMGIVNARKSGIEQ